MWEKLKENKIKVKETAAFQGCDVFPLTQNLW